MAGRCSPVLHEIRNGRLIGWDTDPDFMYLLIQALLLTLKEEGRLDGTLLQHAMEKLKTEHRGCLRRQGEAT